MLSDPPRNTHIHVAHSSTGQLRAYPAPLASHAIPPAATPESVPGTPLMGLAARMRNAGEETQRRDQGGLVHHAPLARIFKINSARPSAEAPVRSLAVGQPHAGIANARRRRQRGVAIGRPLRTVRPATERAETSSTQAYCEKFAGRRPMQRLSAARRRRCGTSLSPRPKSSQKGRHFCPMAPGWPTKARRNLRSPRGLYERLRASAIYKVI